MPTYQSAWLKTHHTAAFLAGVLTHDPGMYPKRLILDDARQFGVAVLPLDVNTSDDVYRVMLLNDDETPMEFVVGVLEDFFDKDHEMALRMVLRIHHQGIGQCGVYPFEAARTKVTQVMDFARKHQHPLQCVMEKT